LTMTSSRIAVFTGRFGSGKTEIAINCAVDLAGQGLVPLLIDLDIVTPYFRTRDKAQDLESLGVEVIAPYPVGQHIHIPAINPQIRGAIEQCERPVGWLSLDERDNDLAAFLSYLVAAIHNVFPGACPATLGLSRALQMPPSDYVAATLANEMASLPEAFVLVLDDYHSICLEAIHRLLAALLHDLPRQVHLVLACRTDPPFPLSSLRAGRQMLDIRAKDLRFSLDEMQAFLEQSGQRPPIVRGSLQLVVGGSPSGASTCGNPD